MTVLSRPRRVWNLHKSFSKYWRRHHSSFVQSLPTEEKEITKACLFVVRWLFLGIRSHIRWRSTIGLQIKCRSIVGLRIKCRSTVRSWSWWRSIVGSDSILHVTHDRDEDLMWQISWRPHVRMHHIGGTNDKRRTRSRGAHFMLFLCVWFIFIYELEF